MDTHLVKLEAEIVQLLAVAVLPHELNGLAVLVCSDENVNGKLRVVRQSEHWIRMAERSMR